MLSLKPFFMSACFVFALQKTKHFTKLVRLTDTYIHTYIH